MWGNVETQVTPIAKYDFWMDKQILKRNHDKEWLSLARLREGWLVSHVPTYTFLGNV